MKDNRSPFVSVVIPVHNGQEHLAGLFECLKRQEVPVERVEYIFVNNMSTDNTTAILADFTNEASKVNLRVQVFTENTIQSAPAARNEGIRRAKGDIIAFTDVDCLPESHWLSELIKPFDDTGVCIVAGEVLPFGGKTIVEKYSVSHMLVSQKKTLGHHHRPYAQTANMAVRRSVLERSGLFRPYVSAGEDADLCWRITAENGCGIFLAGKAVVEHKMRKTINGLMKQFYLYGQGDKYLKELYGVRRPYYITTRRLLLNLVSWGLKTLPLSAFKVISGKADLVKLFEVPLDLLSDWSRYRGFKKLKLPSEFEMIDRLDKRG